jgi:TonB family protein
MSTVRAGGVVALALVSVVMAAGSARAQDTLARAKDAYASAAYEDALRSLQALGGNGSSADATEVAAYEVFCLMALGRSDEAKHVIEGLVRLDPQYHLSEAQASPRVRAFFETVRKPLLPDIIRQSYAHAKDAYGLNDMPMALSAFDRVIALIDEMDTSEDQGLADLRTLAVGFRDLSKVAASSARPAAPAAEPGRASDPPKTDKAIASPVAPAAPAAPPIFNIGEPGVIGAIALAKPLPPWQPAPSEAKLNFYGIVEIIVGEDGRVVTATILKSVNARYDSQLLAATRNWKFRPATKDGVPVRFRYTMTVHLTSDGVD